MPASRAISRTILSIRSLRGGLACDIGVFLIGVELVLAVAFVDRVLALFSEDAVVVDRFVITLG